MTRENKYSTTQMYRKRAEDQDLQRKYTLASPTEMFIRHSRERDLFRLFNTTGIPEFRNSTVLEVGCGKGIQVGEYLRWGAQPANIIGIDVLPEFLQEARLSYPGVHFLIGSALQLPVEDQCIDIISQSTVMSSINAESDRKLMAKEMLRVLKPGGTLLWYDMRYPSHNKQVRPINATELNALFDGCKLLYASTTLLPPIARLITPRAWWLATLLALIPPLRSHLRAVIVKPL